MNEPAIIFSSFIVVVACELYLFAMQRSSLEISRESNIDPKVGRLMLPLWYASVWPIKVAKYFLMYLIYTVSGIWVAVACLVTPFLLSAVMPIPHRYFISIFEKKLNKDSLGENLSNNLVLKHALYKVKNKYFGTN